MDDEQKTNIDEDNITLIISVILSTLKTLPEDYTIGFEEYIRDYLVESAIPVDGQHEYAEFWEHLVLCYFKYYQFTLEEIHNKWVEDCATRNWNFNTSFDYERKTCPLLINFHNLSLEETSLVRLFSSITWALGVVSDAVDENEALEAE